MLWFVVFVVSLLVAVVLGRVYCGYACPMNTLMIPTEWLSRKLKLQVDQHPKWLRSGNLGWFALVASILVMVISQIVLGKNVPVLLVWLALSVLITLRYKPAVFHNLICPFGPPQKVFGRFAMFSERVNKEGCTGCKLCEGVCPSDAIKVKAADRKAEVEPAFCFQCTNCQQVCPTDTISYVRSR